MSRRFLGATEVQVCTKREQSLRLPRRVCILPSFIGKRRNLSALETRFARRSPR
jgi:hypothetical protein